MGCSRTDVRMDGTAFRVMWSSSESEDLLTARAHGCAPLQRSNPPKSERYRMDGKVSVGLRSMVSGLALQHKAIGPQRTVASAGVLFDALTQHFRASKL